MDVGEDFGRVKQIAQTRTEECHRRFSSNWKLGNPADRGLPSCMWWKLWRSSVVGWNRWAPTLASLGGCATWLTSPMLMFWSTSLRSDSASESSMTI